VWLLALFWLNQIGVSMSQLTQAAIQEVYDCHVLIETWFHGKDDATADVLNKLLVAFDSHFSMVNPGGGELDATGLETFLSGMHGARPTVKIEVTVPQVVVDSDDFCVLRYQELQHLDGSLLHRSSTAVFCNDGTGRAKWRHLHETWMPKE
jgi:hypothetical protein